MERHDVNCLDAAGLTIKAWTPAILFAIEDMRRFPLGKVGVRVLQVLAEVNGAGFSCKLLVWHQG